MGRHYIIESDNTSEILCSGPLQHLRKHTYHTAVLDRCACGEKEHCFKKKCYFQSSRQLHHLNVQCPGGHIHVPLRRHTRHHSAAVYSAEECRLIMLDCCQVPANASEGGRKPASHALLPATTDKSGGSTFDSSEDTLFSDLYKIAREKELHGLWSDIVEPWLSGVGSEMVKMVSITFKAIGVCSAKVQDRAAPAAASDDMPFDPGRPQIEESGPSGVHHTSDETSAPDLKDQVIGHIPEEPWQHKKYSADNTLWQGAALYRKMHHRRSNVSLGACSVDLSGPNEPTPRPGGQIIKDPYHYFLALTVRLDTN